MYIFLLLSIIIAHVGLYKIFEKAGVAGWKALVPVYGGIEWFKIVGQPLWKYVLMWIPLVNIFMLAAILIDTSDSFGKHSFWHHLLAVVFAPLYLCYLGFDAACKYLWPSVTRFRDWKSKMATAVKNDNKLEIKQLEASNPFHKGATREWAESIIFAVFAATFIRMFLIEAYTIPTQSMEGSLLVGDFLFVSKPAYGIRTPSTPLMAPLVHNTLPFSTRESYLDWLKLPTKRLFGSPSTSLKRNDPVVFNFPEGDTIVKSSSVNLPTNNYYSLLRYKLAKREDLLNNKNIEIVSRPLDKRDHYVKRCIGLPGEKIFIKERQVYIDDKAIQNPSNIQFKYGVKTNGGNLNESTLLDWGVNIDDIRDSKKAGIAGYYELHLNQGQLAKLKALPDVVSVEVIKNNALVFPDDPAHFSWTVDDFGPLLIPKKGSTVKIDASNIALFRRIITAYEGNTLAVKDGKIFINDRESSEYTFKQNYYWMMGDNRHNSEDSRFWGFVPEDHIVGKPLFIWMSYVEGNPAKGVRWNRFFTSAHRM